MPIIKALIDGDIEAYKAASAVEKAIDWGDDLWTLHADLREARILFDDAIAAIVESTKAGELSICFSAGTNFRRDIYPPYKANRSGKRKPLVLSALREHAEKLYDTYTRPGLEADDCLGILATRPQKGVRPIVVSIDKDLRQIPGRHFDDLTGKVREISASEGNLAFLLQVLTGDTTDNYPGCPAVGPKRAEALLSGLDALPPEKALAEGWSIVLEAYRKAGLTAEDALVQARVARILRHGDYDYENRQPILWSPPNAA